MKFQLRKQVVLGLAVLIGGTVAAFANDFELMSSFEFAAPVVPDKTASSVPKQTGLIVYDAGTDEFYGVDKTGSWLNLSRKLNPLYAYSSTKSPTTSGDYLAMTNNKLTLTPGTWILRGEGYFIYNSGSPGYSQVEVGWYAANGADSSTEPTALTLDFGMPKVSFPAPTAQTMAVNASTVRITVTSGTQDVYLVPRPLATTIAYSRVEVFAWAERIDR